MLNLKSELKAGKKINGNGAYASVGLKFQRQKQILDSSASSDLASMPMFCGHFVPFWFLLHPYFSLLDRARQITHTSCVEVCTGRLENLHVHRVLT